MTAVERRHLAGLLDGSWRNERFAPFRPGVEICELVAGEPQVALLRYAPGARVPRHRHTALETVVVLHGEQCDERGCYPAGSVVFNPPGSQHSVWSDSGCVVLIHWTQPVQMLEQADSP